MPNSKQERYEGFLKRQSFENVCKYATMGLMRIELMKTKIHHQEKDFEWNMYENGQNESLFFTFRLYEARNHRFQKKKT